MAPQPMERDLQDLRDDAKKWHGTAEVMTKAKTVVDGEAGLSSCFGFLGEETGANTTYTSVNTVLSTLGGQAATELQYGADALNRVAAVYAQTEKDNDATIKEGWHF
ncbi:hypothetical protein GCM10027589_23310 [Actinocorallia lasiicapitis]